MLDWVEAGVRDSLATYCALRGVTPPRRLPFIGPRKTPIRRSIASVELNSGQVYDGIEFVVESPWWSTGVGNQDLGERLDHVTFRDCVFTGGTKWASRSYRTRRNIRFVNCAFRLTWPEHDVYHNLAGYNEGEAGWDAQPSMFFVACYFENTGSQNVQLVQRAQDWYGQTPPSDLTPGGPIVMIDCLSRNAGLGLDHPEGIEGKGYEGDPRPAFALSFFASQNNVYLRRCVIDKTMQRRSSGCVLLEGRRRSVLEACVFMSADTTQPLALIRDQDEVVIRKSYFGARSGQNMITFENVRRYLIEDCSGTARVMRNRTMYGPVTTRQEYTSQ